MAQSEMVGRCVREDGSLHIYSKVFQASSNSRMKWLMSLNVYYSKYGKYTPQKLPSQSGALKFNIPQYMLENLLAEGFTIKEISAIICVADMHTGK